MTNRATIIGVHEVAADEPVHLLEIELAGNADEFDFGEVTQVLPDRPQANWQVAYDEREIDSPTTHRRFAFFFHFLDFKAPLLTSFGELEIPQPTPRPDRLSEIEYETP